MGPEPLIQHLDTTITWRGLEWPAAEQLFYLHQAFSKAMVKLVSNDCTDLPLDVPKHRQRYGNHNSLEGYHRPHYRPVYVERNELVETIKMCLQSLGSSELSPFRQAGFTDLLLMYLASRDSLYDVGSDNSDDMATDLQIHYSPRSAKLPRPGPAKVEVAWFPDMIEFNELAGSVREGDGLYIVPQYCSGARIRLQMTNIYTDVKYHFEPAIPWLDWDDEVAGFCGEVPYFSQLGHAGSKGATVIPANQWTWDGSSGTVRFVLKAKLTISSQSAMYVERTLRARLSIQVIPRISTDSTRYSEMAASHSELINRGRRPYLRHRWSSHERDDDDCWSIKGRRLNEMPASGSAPIRTALPRPVTHTLRKPSVRFPEHPVPFHSPFDVTNCGEVERQLTELDPTSKPALNRWLDQALHPEDKATERSDNLRRQSYESSEYPWLLREGVRIQSLISPRFDARGRQDTTSYRVPLARSDVEGHVEKNLEALNSKDEPQFLEEWEPFFVDASPEFFAIVEGLHREGSFPRDQADEKSQGLVQRNDSRQCSGSYSGFESDRAPLTEGNSKVESVSSKGPPHAPGIQLFNFFAPLQMSERDTSFSTTRNGSGIEQMMQPSHLRTGIETTTHLEVGNESENSGIRSYINRTCSMTRAYNSQEQRRAVHSDQGVRQRRSIRSENSTSTTVPLPQRIPSNNGNCSMVGVSQPYQRRLPYQRALPWCRLAGLLTPTCSDDSLANTWASSELDLVLDCDDTRQIDDIKRQAMLRSTLRSPSKSQENQAKIHHKGASSLDPIQRAIDTSLCEQRVRRLSVLGLTDNFDHIFIENSSDESPINLSDESSSGRESVRKMTKEDTKGFIFHEDSASQKDGSPEQQFGKKPQRPENIEGQRGPDTPSPNLGDWEVIFSKEGPQLIGLVIARSGVV